MDVSNNTYIKQKVIAEKFSFHCFPKAIDTLFHKLLEKNGLFVVEGNHDYNRVNS
jgi:hypothetical protein